MPLGERLLRAVERVLQPWYDRPTAERELEAADQKLRAEEAKGAHTEVIRQDAIAARIDAERVRQDYLADAAARSYRERLTGVVEPKPRPKT